MHPQQAFLFHAYIRDDENLIVSFGSTIPFPYVFPLAHVPLSYSSFSSLCEDPSFSCSHSVSSIHRDARFSCVHCVPVSILFFCRRMRMEPLEITYSISTSFQSACFFIFNACGWNHWSSHTRPSRAMSFRTHRSSNYHCNMGRLFQAVRFSVDIALFSTSTSNMLRLPRAHFHRSTPRRHIRKPSASDPCIQNPDLVSRYRLLLEHSFHAPARYTLA